MKSYLIKTYKAGIFTSEFCNNYNAVVVYAQHLFDNDYDVEVLDNEKVVLRLIHF